MTVLRTTLRLYLEAARDAFLAFPRTLWALVFLLVAGIAMNVGMMLLGSTGFAGGLVLGLIQCVLIGAYLALLEIGLVRKRKVVLDDLTGNLGTYFGRTLSVGFALSIPMLILQFVSFELAMLWALLTALVFNSAVEQLYQERAEDFMEIFRGSIRFQQANWPEWFGGHLPILLPLGLLFGLLGGGQLTVALLVGVLKIYSPHYEFFTLSTVAGSFLRTGPVGIALGIGLLALNHLVLLYRGALYARLSRSNRRARAWQARAEGR